MRWPGSAALLAALALTASAASAAARLHLVLAPEEGGGLQVVAVVTDAPGSPREGIPVTFRARTAFGWLPLGEGVTDASGRAVLPLPAGAPYPEIEAQTADDPPARAVLALDRRAAAQPAVRPGRRTLHALSPQPGLISPYPVPPLALLGVLVGAIWATYGYIVFLLTRIAAGR